MLDVGRWTGGIPPRFLRGFGLDKNGDGGMASRESLSGRRIDKLNNTQRLAQGQGQSRGTDMMELRRRCGTWQAFQVGYMPPGMPCCLIQWMR